MKGLESQREINVSINYRDYVWENSRKVRLRVYGENDENKNEILIVDYVDSKEDFYSI